MPKGNQPTIADVARHADVSIATVSRVLVEEDPWRRARAEALGFESLHGDDPGLVLKTRWRHGPAARGADVVFQCRGRSRALATALRIVRPQGTVVDMAFYTESGEAVMARAVASTSIVRRRARPEWPPASRSRPRPRAGSTRTIADT